MLTGADIVIEVLRSEGVSKVFGNPGSTELALIDAIDRAPDIQYVLGLHESCVIPMADGYAQATGRPSFVNVHTMSGLGNAIGALTNARANGTPMVVTAGQQHQDFLITDPLLSFDLVALARPVSKWAAQVERVDDLGTLLRRAFQDAATPPTGPVFLSLPTSVMEARTSRPVPPVSKIDRRIVAGGVEELAVMLRGTPAGKLALILAQEVAHADAIDCVQELATMLGAPVFGASNVPVGVFPPAHALWRGFLPHNAAGIRKTLSSFDRVLFVGGQPFQTSSYVPGPPLPETVELLHISADPLELGRTYPVTLGLYGSLRETLSALLQQVREQVDGDQAAAYFERHRHTRKLALDEQEARALSTYGPAPMEPMAAIHALLRAAPADVVVVDEGVSNSVHIRNLHLWTKPGSMYSGKQIIGWGMPAAIGISLAHGGARPVLCIASDGGTTFSLQALWSAAHEGLPVVFAVLVNREYGILRKLLTATMPGSQLQGAQAFDLSRPAIDYVAIARSMGVDGRRVEHTNELAESLREAYSMKRPCLLEIPITR